MTPRIGLGIVCGALAAAIAAAIAWSGKDWLRVMIAPAWRTGVLVSESADSPNIAIVIGVAFVFGFTVGFFGWTLTVTQPQPGADQVILVATNLILLVVLVGLELIFYPRIAGSLLNAAEAHGGLGSEYPLVLASRLVPGALLFVILATILAFGVLRKSPGRTPIALVAIWLCNLLALLASVSWYVSPQGPGSS